MPPEVILKFSLASAALLGAIILALRWGGALEPEKATVELAERVLAAVARGDYAAFVAHADQQVGRMRVEDFRRLTERHAPRLRNGHELRPVDERWRGTVHVRRWTVTFKDGSPDAIVTLGVRDGRVATFAMY